MLIQSEIADRAEENKALVRRLNAAIERADLDEVSQLLAPNLVHHRRGLEATFPFILRGRPKPKNPKEGFRLATEAIGSTFVGWHAAEVAMYCDGNTVIARQQMSGTVNGLFPGASHRDAPFEFPMVVIFTISDSRITEIWALGDELGFWKQLGLPLPDQPPAT